MQICSTAIGHKHRYKFFKAQYLLDWVASVNACTLAALRGISLIIGQKTQVPNKRNGDAIRTMKNADAISLLTPIPWAIAMVEDIRWIPRVKPPPLPDFGPRARGGLKKALRFILPIILTFSMEILDFFTFFNGKISRKFSNFQKTMIFFKRSM